MTTFTLRALAPLRESFPQYFCVPFASDRPEPDEGCGHSVFTLVAAMPRKAMSDFPARRQIHARAHRIENEGFGEASVLGQLVGAAGGAG